MDLISRGLKGLGQILHDSHGRELMFDSLSIDGLQSIPEKRIYGFGDSHFNKMSL